MLLTPEGIEEFLGFAFATLFIVTTFSLSYVIAKMGD